MPLIRELHTCSVLRVTSSLAAVVNGTYVLSSKTLLLNGCLLIYLKNVLILRKIVNIVYIVYLVLY